MYLDILNSMNLLTSTPASSAPPGSLKAAARRFQALSDPTRLRVLRVLLEGEHCVCDIADHLEVAQPRLSFHLKTLRDAGIVSDRRVGRWAYYRIVPEVVDSMVAALEPLQTARCGIGSGSTCCGGQVGTEAGPTLARHPEEMDHERG